MSGIRSQLLGRVPPPGDSVSTTLPREGTSAFTVVVDVSRIPAGATHVCATAILSPDGLDSLDVHAATKAAADTAVAPTEGA